MSTLLQDLEARLTNSGADFASIDAYVSAAWPNETERAGRFLATLRSANPNRLDLTVGQLLLAERLGAGSIRNRMAVAIVKGSEDALAALAIPAQRLDDIRAYAAAAAALDGTLAELGRRSASEAPLSVLADLERLLTSNLSDTRVIAAYFHFCEVHRLPDEALALYERLRGLPSSPTALAFHVAKVLDASGDSERAIEFALMAIAEHPRLPGPAAFVTRLCRSDRSLIAAVDRVVATLQPQAVDHAALRDCAAAARSVGSAPDAQGLLRQARALEVAGKRTEAVRAYMRWATLANSVDAFLESARQAERLGEYGRAEFMYNQARHIDRSNVGAQEGLARVQNAKQGHAGSTSGGPNLLRAAETLLHGGAIPEAIGYLMTWAKQEGTADAQLHVAKLCEEHKQIGLAVHIYERVLATHPSHSTALENVKRLRGTLAQNETLDLTELTNSLHANALESALKIAASLLQSGPSLSMVTSIVALLRRARLGDELTWVPNIPVRTFVFWLHEKSSDQDLVAAAYSLPECNLLAARLALAEERWADAILLSDRATGADSLTISAVRGYCVFRSSTQANATNELPPLSVLLDPILAELEPAGYVSTIQAPSIGLKELLTAAADAYRERDFVEAAYLYGVAGQGRLSGATEARKNEAVARMRLEDFRAAQQILLDLLRLPKHSRDGATLWNLAICSARLEQYKDALSVLDRLLQIHPNHRAGRLLGAAMAVKAHQHPQALLHLQAHGIQPGGVKVAVLALRIAEDGRVPGASALWQSLGHVVALPGVSGTVVSEADYTSPVTTSQLSRDESTTARSVATRLIRNKASAQEVKGVVASLSVGGNHDDAIELLRHLATDVPAYVPFRLLWIEELVKARRPEEALEVFRRLGDVSSGERKPFGEQNLQIVLRCFVSAGFSDEAVQALTSPGNATFAPKFLADIVDELATESLTTRSVVRLAQFSVKAKLGDKGEALFRTALARSPDDVEVRRACEQYAPTLLVPPPVDADELRNTFDRYAKAGSAQAAVELVLSRTAGPNTDPELKRLRADAFHYVGRDRDAVATMQSLVTEETELLRSKETAGSKTLVKQLRHDLLKLASLYAQLADNTAELQVYMTLLERDPFDADVHRHMKAIGQSSNLPCEIADHTLLQECSRVFTSGRLRDQVGLAEKLRALGDTQDVRDVLRVLRAHQPTVRSWSQLEEEYTAPTLQAPGARGHEVAHLSGRHSDKLPRETEVGNLVLVNDRKSAPGASTGTKPTSKAAGASIWERRRDSWQRFRRQPTRFVDALQSLAPTLWRSAHAANPALSDRVSDATFHELERTAGFLRRSSSGEERLDILVEQLWLFRLWRFRPELFGGPRRQSAAVRMLQVFRDDVLPEALWSLRDIDPLTATGRAGEIVEVALDLLLKHERRLRYLLESVRNLAVTVRVIVEPESAHEVTRFEENEKAARTYAARLTKAGSPVPEAVCVAMHGLASQWLAIVETSRHDLSTLPRLLTQVRVLKDLDLADSSSGLELALELAIVNAGESTALDISCRLNQIPDITIVLRGQCPVELEAGSKASVVISLRGLSTTVEAIAVTGELRYRSHGQFRDVTLIEGVVVPPWASRVIGLALDTNPYQVGPPVSPRNRSFIDRPELLRRIRQALGSGVDRNAVLLHGLRRVGKTSLLNALLTEPGEDIPVLVNLQGLAAADVGTAQVLSTLAHKIARAVKVAVGISLPIPPDLDWTVHPTVAMSSFLDGVEDALPSRRILLMLDEYEVLLEKIINDQVDKGILAYFRTIMQTCPTLVFLIVGANRIRDMVRSHDTALFNLVFPIQVGYFEPDEAKRLVEEPVKGLLTFANEATAALVDQTAGHPFFLAQLCFEVVSYMSRLSEPRRLVTALDIHRILRGTAQQNDRVHELEWMLNSTGLSDVERVILVTIAHRTESALCDIPALVERLGELGWEIDEVAVYDHVLRLETLDLIVRTSRPGGVEDIGVKLPLFAQWMRRARDPRLIADEARAQTAADDGSEDVTSAIDYEPPLESDAGEDGSGVYVPEGAAERSSLDTVVSVASGGVDETVQVMDSEMHPRATVGAEPKLTSGKTARVEAQAAHPSSGSPIPSIDEGHRNAAESQGPELTVAAPSIALNGAPDSPRDGAPPSLESDEALTGAVRIIDNSSARNPYGALGLSDSMFFGRDTWLADARSLLCSPPNKGHLQIYGPPRMGKSALLGRIHRMVRNQRPDAVTVVLSGHQFAGLRAEDFWAEYYRRLSLAAATPAGTPSNTRLAVAQLAAEVAQRGGTTFTFIDEFEQLAKHLTLDDFRVLRALGDQLDVQAMFVIATRRNIGELAPDAVTSDFVGLFRSSTAGALQPLDHNAALDMVLKPASQARLEFSVELAEAIYRMCKGHPWLTARMAFSLTQQSADFRTKEMTLRELFEMFKSDVGFLLSPVRRICEHTSEHRDNLTHLVRSNFQLRYGSELPAVAELLIDCGLVTNDGGLLKPVGALTELSLKEYCDLLPDSDKPATNHELRDFDEEVKGLEQRLKGYLDQTLATEHGDAWHLETKIVPAEDARRIQRRKGMRFIEKLTFGELLNIAKRELRDTLARHGLSDADLERTGELAQARNDVTHLRQTPLTVDEVRSATNTLRKFSHVLTEMQP